MANADCPYCGGSVRISQARAALHKEIKRIRNLIDSHDRPSFLSDFSILYTSADKIAIGFAKKV